MSEMAAENGEFPSQPDQHTTQPQIAPNADPQSERAGETGRPYSIFKPWEKKAIVFTASLSAVFSPMSTTIYLPALNQLAADLHVSDSEINLTVTTFMVSCIASLHFTASVTVLMSVSRQDLTRSGSVSHRWFLGPSWSSTSFHRLLYHLHRCQLWTCLPKKLRGTYGTAVPTERW